MTALTCAELLLEIRYRCMTDRHPGSIYNRWSNETWCWCGTVVRGGDCVVPLSEYERAELNADRSDEIGEQAREFLARTHGRSVCVVRGGVG